MVPVLKKSRSGDQRLFEVLAERGLQRVKPARRGIGQIGFENLLNPRIPLFLVASKLLLVGPERDRQHFLISGTSGRISGKPSFFFRMGRASFFTTRMNSSFFSVSGTNSRMRANTGKSPFVLEIVKLIPRDFFLIQSAGSAGRVQRSRNVVQ